MTKYILVGLASVLGLLCFVYWLIKPKEQIGEDLGTIKIFSLDLWDSIVQYFIALFDRETVSTQPSGIHPVINDPNPF